MTEKEIRKLLSDRNKDKVDGKVITRPLSETVHYSKIWFKELFSFHQHPRMDMEPLSAYFILEKGKQYIAIVVVDENLKWYVLPQFRKGDTFLNPFREVVIPHLLQHKPIQRFLLHRREYSIKEFAFLKKTALSAGFRIIRANEMEVKMAIEAASLGKREYISGKNTGLSEKRKQEISKEITSFIQKLRIFETELALKTANLEVVDDFKEVEDMLDSLSLNFRGRK